VVLDQAAAAQWNRPAEPIHRSPAGRRQASGWSRPAAAAGRSCASGRRPRRGGAKFGSFAVVGERLWTTIDPGGVAVLDRSLSHGAEPAAGACSTSPPG